MTPDESSIITALGMILAAFATYLAGFAMLNASRRRFRGDAPRDETEDARGADGRRRESPETFAGAHAAWEHTPY